jgi:hypothetical protein
MENGTLDNSHVVVAAPVKAKRGRKPGQTNSGPKKVKPRKALLLPDGHLQLMGRGRPKTGATIVVLDESNYHLLVASGTVVEASPTLDSPTVAVG